MLFSKTYHIIKVIFTEMFVRELPNSSSDLQVLTQVLKHLLTTCNCQKTNFIVPNGKTTEAVRYLTVKLHGMLCCTKRVIICSFKGTTQLYLLHSICTCNHNTIAVLFLKKHLAMKSPITASITISCLCAHIIHCLN